MPDPVSLRLVADAEPGGAHLAVADSANEPVASPNSLEQMIVTALADAHGPFGRTALRDNLRVRNERLGEALALVANRGAIVRIGDRWAVPVPAST